VRKIGLWLFYSGLVLSLAGIGTSSLFSQEETTPPASETSAQTQEQTQEETAEDTFIYLPRGRRDPFWDLMTNAKAGKDSKGREAIPGIAGLMIDELELEGIIYKGGKYYAAMRGPDSLPYLVTVGDSVYDGEIVKIDSYSVIFKKILTIAIGGATERLISKRLNPEEEQEK